VFQDGQVFKGNGNAWELFFVIFRPFPGNALKCVFASDIPKIGHAFYSGNAYR
jgi:hypothetical protein